MRFVFHSGVAVLLLGLPAAVPMAGPVRLDIVKDLDAGAEMASSAPQRFRTIDGKVYFAAKTPASGEELFVSDGAAGQAQRVADLAPGPASSAPVPLGKTNGKLILSADDGVSGVQFWSVDAAGAATRLTSTSMPATNLRAVPLGNAGGRLVFQGSDRRIWSTDGSAAGTQQLGNLYGHESRWPACSAGGRVLMLTQQDFDTRIVSTDGTPANTAMLVSEIDVEGAYVAGDGNYCYFGFNAYPHWKIWRTDGTPSGTSLWRESASSSWLCGLAVAGAQVYALEEHNGFRLIHADTQAVQLSLPQNGCGRPAGIQVAAGRLAFFAPQPGSDGNWNQALYLSDGTAAGTRQVPRPADLYSWQDTRIAAIGERFAYLAHFSGPHSVDPVTAVSTPLPGVVHGLFWSDMAALGGTVLMSGYDASSGQEVWRSDGTVDGTTLLHDVATANGSGLPYAAPTSAAIGDTLYFLRQAAIGDLLELWRSDGSAAGTTMLARSHYGNLHIYDAIPLGAGLLFTARPPGQPGMSVYRADAALSTASPVWSDNTYPSVLQPIPGGGALYDCDGTGSGNVCALPPGGVQPVIAAPGLQATGNLRPLGQLAGGAFFLAAASASGAPSLWRSDGTAPGTYRVAPDIYPPEYGGVPRQPAAAAHGGRLWFHACAGAGGSACGLYVSDGSGAGTRRIASLPAVRDIKPLGAGVAALAGTSSTQLWISDGTESGTRPLASFGAGGPAMASAGGFVHFTASKWDTAVYYVSDGTAAGTRAVTLPAEFLPLAAAPVALDEDSLVLRCTSPATGEELCVTDAAASQVRLLRDAFPGPSSSLPAFLGKAGTAAYFSIDDGSRGRELWRAHVLGDAIFAGGFE